MLLVRVTNILANINDPTDTSIYISPTFPGKGYKLYRTNPQQSFQYFNDALSYFKQKGDTANYITCLLGLSDLERRKGQYNKAFDILNDIQKNVIRKIDTTAFTDLNTRLGRLYGIFGKDSIALYHHKKALEVCKAQKYDKTGSSYYAIAEQYAKMNDYNTCITYLDSCYLISTNNNRLIYVDAYYAYAYIKKSNYRKADIYLKGLIQKFDEKKLGFASKVYTFHAELKKALNQPDSAIFYYNKALSTVNSMKMHYDIKPMILEQLALLNYEKGNTHKAFSYMQKQKAVSDSLFHLQSKQNQELFEVKREYQKNLFEKDEQINQQQYLINLKDKASFRLKLLISILILLAAIGLLMFRQRFLMKQMILKKEKNEAILETKNKELTANALQIIEKEQGIKELLEEIKDSKPEKFKTLSNKYKQGNAKIWDDFHLRFTQTNNKFYEQLMKLYPSLTHTDLKYCALIKLNFDSKEMSHILGISLHSVHMARSRIRKKIGLSRDESLGDYLSSI
ncbi:helix-turn-helix transcriptional regulator [Labilibacter marinus]|uniref:helix-turn-helix transcriptional regulator n=1 Tax=Labilibacter marinus TaxID=1477105 RepID=UPI00117ABA10|nr:hypothetical protein [Labilibacter marinus]